MKELRIERLTLQNFKGVRERQDLVLRTGQDADVFGDNATGKTTLKDAFGWLLFGKDSQGRADFEIKTLGPDGEAAHGLEHVVAAVLMHGERRLELRKVYKEKWTKKRGQADTEFTGHETKHFVDDVPMPKREYEIAIAEIANEATFRTLTDPAHFAERLHWQDRRTTLLDVCGDVSDADVIASSPALADLPDVLGGRSMEDHRKVIGARRIKINKELSDIPVRIDQETKGLPDVEDLDGAKLKIQLRTVRVQRSNAEQERVRIESGGEVAEKTKRLREVEAEMLAMHTRTCDAANVKLAAERRKGDQVSAEIADATRQVTRCDADVREAAAEIERLYARMCDRRALWRVVDAEKSDVFSTEPDECAACGQKLPADQVEAARSKAVAEFNANKSRRLADIDVEGKQLKDRRDELVGGSEERIKALEAAEEIADELEGKLAESTERLEAISKEPGDPADDPAYQEATAEKLRLGAAIAALGENTLGALVESEAKLAKLDVEISAAEGSVARIAQHAEGMARINELERDERKLAGQYEELERQLYLTEEFVRVKVSMLTDRINARFELAQFKLFRQLVNGGLDECCEVSFGGVPYRDLNHGARVNVGIDIINTLGAHHGFAPPVFVDNAEAITEIGKTQGQMIRLVVSSTDAELRVETTGEDN